jgi:hypothetical protein
MAVFGLYLLLPALAAACTPNEVVCPKYDQPPSQVSATHPRYAYFIGCGEWEHFSSAEVARTASTLSPCQQNIIESPFEYIIYSFVNGKQRAGELGGRVDPFQLDFINDATTLDPWLARALDKNFASKMSARGKKLMISIGGGDVDGDSPVAMGRVFTSLFVNQTVNSEATTDWVQLVGRFVNGDNQENVVFDGVDFDNEEGHHPDDGSLPSTTGEGKNCSTNPAFPFWQCPYHTETGGEVLTSANGVEFIADLSIRLRAELDRNKRKVQFTTALQPSFYTPALYGRGNCGNSTTECPFDPLLFDNVFPHTQSEYRNLNCYMHMFSMYPDAADVYDDFIFMLYPNSNFRNWGPFLEGVGESTAFYDGENKYNVPMIVQEMENYSYVDQTKSPGVMPYNTTAVLRTISKLVIAVQGTARCEEDTYICPDALDTQAKETNAVVNETAPRNLAVWNMHASCDTQRYFHSIDSTAYSISPFCDCEELTNTETDQAVCDPVTYQAWTDIIEIEMKIVSELYVITMSIGIVLAVIIFAWYLLLLPLAERHGVKFPQMNLVRSLRLHLGYHVRTTKLEGWEHNDLRRQDTQRESEQRADGWLSASTEDCGEDDVLNNDMRSSWASNQIDFDEIDLDTKHVEQLPAVSERGDSEHSRGSFDDGDSLNASDDLAQSSLAKAAHELSQAIASENNSNGEFSDEAYERYTVAAKLFKDAAVATADKSMQAALHSKAQHASLCSEELRNGSNRSAFHEGGFSHSPFVHSVGGVSKTFDLTAVPMIEQALHGASDEHGVHSTAPLDGVFSTVKAKLSAKFKRHLSAQEKARLTAIVHMLRAVHSTSEGDMKADMQEVVDRLSSMAPTLGGNSEIEHTLEDVEVTCACGM